MSKEYLVSYIKIIKKKKYYIGVVVNVQG